LNKKDFGSIRECLKGKVYTFTEEDTGDQVEFIKSDELLLAFNSPDKSGLVCRLLGNYVPLELISNILSRLGFEEDLPESKK